MTTATAQRLKAIVESYMTSVASLAEIHSSTAEANDNFNSSHAMQDMPFPNRECNGVTGRIQQWFVRDSHTTKV